MPFPMKITPIDSQTFDESSLFRNDVVVKPVLKSRLKRLFDRPFNSVLRISSAAPTDKPTGGKEVVECFEPSSVCLDKMVQNFIEENNEKPQPPSVTVKCGRNRCNCFNGNLNDSSDDEFDFSYGFSDSFSTSNHSSITDSSDTLKSLIPCASKAERNLLADTSNIVEKNKACKRKHDLRKIVTDGLIALGYNTSICKSKWDKSSSIPAGEYEYIDVIVEGERILIDVDFRSEFEIARSTGSYKAMLQSLPFIFVGKADRLLQIILIISEAGKQSLKKKGMHIAPWRKADYSKAKWLSSFTRLTSQNDIVNETQDENGVVNEIKPENGVVDTDDSSEFDLIFGEQATSFDINSDGPPEEVSGEEEKLMFPMEMTWQPQPTKGNKVIVTGLASLLKEKP